MGDILATLDAAKVATTILFVTSVASPVKDSMQREIIDDWGKQIIVSCLAQGLPSTIVAVHNIQRLHMKVSSCMFNILNLSVDLFLLTDYCLIHFKRYNRNVRNINNLYNVQFQNGFLKKKCLN